MPSLEQQFGKIDIYLFDQLLRGNIRPGMKIFDAGCGAGRNLVYFFREGYEVFGADANPAAVRAVQQLAGKLAPQLPPDNFRAESIESSTFPDEFADVVIASALLHFAESDHHFQAMLHGLWRVLKPGGLSFCRLSSTIGMERYVKPLDLPHRYRLPGGTEWYLVDEDMLQRLTKELGASMVDPLKTSVVGRERAMTTWVLRK
ncbi:MAG TPA: class I SAM-dependent methyltransferase [Verrucomicrobiae bacterium]|nr:class I SAM-dependent methyltransferase [Verrucomicrobiae bacterium]